MSFSVTIPATDANDFAAAVDAIAVGDLPSGVDTDAAKELFNAATFAVKELASVFDGQKPLAGTISGHGVDDGSSSNSVYVGVYETQLPPPVEEPAPAPAPAEEPPAAAEAAPEPDSEGAGDDAAPAEAEAAAVA